MRPPLKIAAAVLVNFSLFANQVLAYLPEITFESPDYEELDLVGIGSSDGWESLYGSASITGAGEGFGGVGQALKIAGSTGEEAWLRKPVSWNSAESIAFIDFRIKPAATPEGSLANFLANGTQVAFQIPADETEGELWVLHGNDDDPGDPPAAETWYQTPGTYTVPAGQTVSVDWVRVTLRHDYARNIWDLFVNGNLAAVNLGFEGRGGNLEHLEFFGSLAGDTLVDNLRADPANMLFPDADKDGLPDAWETANGSNPNLYDRDAIDPVTGKSFLDNYLDSLWNVSNPGTPVNGTAGTGNFGTIPPLTILHAHQPVGALKGSLTVGGDGSASYSIPIDIPKGTAGMEPKISLNYSSNGGNGIAGLGWSLSGLQQIVRGGSSYYKDCVLHEDGEENHHEDDEINAAVDGVDFDYKDRFFLDGERLICVSGDYYGAPGSVYRTEMDSFARITAVGGTTSETPWEAGSVPGPTEWKIETKSGLIVTLGGTTESKVARDEGVLSWSVTRVEDSIGNYYRVDHERVVAGSGDPFPDEVRNQRVAAIHYTGQGSADNTYAALHFDYETRPDKRVFYTHGVRQFFDERLEAIRVTTGTNENHRYELRYTTSQQTGRSLLTEVAKIAAGIEIPPTRFEWQTVGRDEEKWVLANERINIQEYAADLEELQNLDGQVARVADDSTQLHLTGTAWHAIPLPYKVTPNTVIEFDYKADVLPNHAMIGMDEDLLTAEPKRLFKLLGSGDEPAPCYADLLETDNQHNLYNYTAAPGTWQAMKISVGQHYTADSRYLVLVNHNTQDTSGDSWFRNIRVYESDNAAAVNVMNFDVAEYGNGLDSRDGIVGMISPVPGDSSQVHLTGAAWRAIPFPYQVTANTVLEFEYRPSGQPTFAMIGLDEDLSTANPKRLFRTVGSGSGPAAHYSDTSEFDNNHNKYNYSLTNGQFESLRIAIGQHFTGHTNHLVLVNDDVHHGSGLGESYFRNIRVYESDNPTVVHTPNWDVDGTVPQMVNNQGGDLGLRIHDFTGDGRADLIYRTFYNKYGTGVDGGVNLDIYGRTMINAPAGFEDSPITTYHNLVTGIKGSSLDAPWARRVDLPSIPVDINADGKIDFGFARNVYKPGTYSLGHGHGFMTWTPTGWVDRSDWALPFTTQNNVNYHRFNHFQFTDLNGDAFPDAVVHMNSGSLMTGQGGSVITTTGSAWINKIGSGGTWEQSTAYVLPKPLKVVGVANGELGRRLLDVNSDGLPDFIEARSLAAKEVYLNTGSGFSSTLADSKYNLPINLTNGNGDDVGARLIDLNGDGLIDAIKDLSYGGADFSTAVHLNTGDGWQQVADGDPNTTPDSWALPDLNFTTFDKYEEAHTGRSSMVDVNADGLIDLVVARWSEKNLIYFNTGTDWVRSDSSEFWGAPEQGQDDTFKVPEPIYRTAAAASSGKAVGTFADVNGDGIADYISDMDKPAPRIWINQCGPEIIEAVTDGFDARLEVEYTNLNDPTPQGPAEKPTYTPFDGTLPEGHIGVIHGGKVVTRLKESDGLGGFRATCRYYGDFRFDREKEASLGFGWTEVHDEHFQAGGGYINRGYTRTETVREYPFGGSPAVSRSYIHVPETMDHQPAVPPGTKLVSEEIAQYGHISGGIAPIPVNAGGPAINRPVQTWSQVKKWDISGVLMSRVTTSQPAANFDQFGFLTQSTIESLDESVTTTSNYYWHGTAPGKWWLGRLLSSQVVKSKGAESVTKKTAFQYDGDSGLLVAEYIEPSGPYAAAGSVASASAPPTTIGHANVDISTPSDPFPGGVGKTYTHDSRGNVEESSVEAYTDITSGATTQTRTSKTEWGHNGRFPVKETSGLGTPFEASVQHYYDPFSALVVATTDIDGRATAFGYDAFGTRITTSRPDATVSAEVTRHVSNDDLPAAIRSVLASHGIVLKWARSAESSGTPWATVYFDVLGREIVQESVALTATEPSIGFRRQFQVTLHDSRGRKYMASNPFFEGDSIHWTTITYDVLDRPVTTLHPDGHTDGVKLIAAVAHASDPRMHTVIYNKRYHKDTAPDHVLERWEDQHGRLVQSKDASGRTTTFGRDLEGRLTDVHIAGNRQLTNTYEPRLGHKIAIDDISGGVSTSRVDGFGEVIRTVNARDQPSTTSYDAVGRVSTVTEPEGSFTTTYRTTTPAIGAPSQIAGSSGYLETYKYGEAPHNYGKVIETTKQQSSAQPTFTSETTYNALGLVLIETDAGGLTVVHDYDTRYGSFELGTLLAGPRPALLSQMVSVEVTATRIISTERLAHDVIRVTETDSRNGRLMKIHTQRGSTVLQDLEYTWDPNGNLLTRTDAKTGGSGSTETFGYDTLDRLDWSQISGQAQVDYVYETNGNLDTKGNTTLAYPANSYRVASAKVKGAAMNNRSYTYDDAGHVTADGKRTYTWTSFGQLKDVYQVSCPALDTFAATGTFTAAVPSIPGIPSWAVYSASPARATFEFDAAGSRSLQSLVRTYATGQEKRSITRYLGSYEIEEHDTKGNSTAPFLRDKTLHRHRLGSALYTSETVGTAAPVVRLAVVLTDHIGSTDVIVRGEWQTNGWTVDGTDSAALNQAAAERQSFDAWGDRRNAANWSELRPADGDKRQTSAMDHDRGFTGHEMLDDFGLVHMNGRIYDPEIGRFLSPDPYVQVPEYSQSFNRYTYVLNNPLSLTDPSGNSWVGDNWLTLVVMVVVAVVTWGVGTAFVGAAGTTGTVFATAGTAATATSAATAGSLTLAGMAATGAIAGFVGGGLNAAVAGGSGSDILRGALVGAVQGAISAGVLHEMGIGAMDAGFFSPESAKWMAGHGIVGGAANEAMGGKFADGFFSAVAGAAIAVSGIYQSLGLGNPGAPDDNFAKVAGRTAIATVAGGTAAEIGGGKFANGAYTAAFQHLLNQEAESLLQTASRRVRELIAYSAERQIGSEQWNFGEFHPDAPPRSDKCNLFCFDMAERGGAAKPKPERTYFGMNDAPPTVKTVNKAKVGSEWSVPGIGRWVKIGSDYLKRTAIVPPMPERGDIITEGGHMGVISGHGKTTHASGTLNRVTINHFGWINKGSHFTPSYDTLLRYYAY